MCIDGIGVPLTRRSRHSGSPWLCLDRLCWDGSCDRKIERSTARRRCASSDMVGDVLVTVQGAHQPGGDLLGCKPAVGLQDRRKTEADVAPRRIRLRQNQAGFLKIEVQDPGGCRRAPRSSVAFVEVKSAGRVSTPLSHPACSSTLDQSMLLDEATVLSVGQSIANRLWDLVTRCCCLGWSREISQ